MGIEFQKCEQLDVDKIHVSKEMVSGLEVLLNNQREFGKKFCNFGNLSLEEKTAWTKEFMTCLNVEFAELLDQLPHKHWKDYTGFEPNLKEIKFEIIDILHFFLSLCLVWDMTAEEMLKYYIAKNKHNHVRQQDPSLGYVKKEETEKPISGS
jgi:dimeric dUTPase (all-alpha-NTP-PPase superfamily)